MEVVAALSSIAGLVSLTLQLGESAIKLKRTYNSIRDAPTTLESLAFELTTMEVLFHQLAGSCNTSHNEYDFLLDMLVKACQAGVLKIANLADRIEHYLRRNRFLGRIYMHSMKDEVARLWQEIERGKSSLFFAWQATEIKRMQDRQDQLIYLAQNAPRSSEQQKLKVADAVKPGGRVAISNG